MLRLLRAPASVPEAAEPLCSLQQLGIAWAGWWVGLSSIQGQVGASAKHHRQESPMDHLADTHVAWKKQGLDQLVGKVRPPSDKRQETCPGRDSALLCQDSSLACLLGTSKSNVNKAVLEKGASSALQPQWDFRAAQVSVLQNTEVLGQKQDTSSCN